MAKYSFEETTIGELLDNPKTAEFLFELVPEAKDHPMLEIGRPFTLEQALPFIETIADSMGITNVAERVEDFKEKLAALD
jgi:hypothetical protein